jgi:hypothetical protein
MSGTEGVFQYFRWFGDNGWPPFAMVSDVRRSLSIAFCGGGVRRFAISAPGLRIFISVILRIGLLPGSQ